MGKQRLCLGNGVVHFRRVSFKLNLFPVIIGPEGPAIRARHSGNSLRSFHRVTSQPLGARPPDPLRFSKKVGHRGLPICFSSLLGAQPPNPRGVTWRPTKTKVGLSSSQRFRGYRSPSNDEPFPSRKRPVRAVGTHPKIYNFWEGVRSTGPKGVPVERGISSGKP